MDGYGNRNLKARKNSHITIEHEKLSNLSQEI